MELDSAVCQRAATNRDRRFDGRFFVGVLTTGVYCRPVCTARAPKPENILFFACAAAAQSAGFRPCMRCRPESSPGTPSWLAAAETVSRALRLIGEGALDGGRSIEGIAERLGVSSRQLRRLFVEHLGASPVEVAGARRAHFARRLIDETDLSMTEVAFAAGFHSVRQFNHAMRETYRRPPSELRHRRRRNGLSGDIDSIHLRLPYRPPLDWDAMTAFLRPRATPGVEAVEQNVYRRTIAFDGRPGVIEVELVPGEAYLTLRLRVEGHEGLIDLVERARGLFDLGADPGEIGRRLRGSRALAPLVRAMPGLRVPGTWDPFELAVRAVLGQQVTVRGATTLAGRLVERYGTPLDAPDGGLTHVFPAPEALAEADLATIGLPRARAGALRALASAVARGDLVLAAPLGPAEAVERLRSVPGIGEWTAQYIAMRALREPDAFPASDLGLRRAVSDGVGPASERALLRLAEEWRPWRAYAAMYLWSAHLIEQRREKTA